MEVCNIPFADYGSMQYFVEIVKYRIIQDPRKTNRCNTKSAGDAYPTPQHFGSL